MDNQGRAEQAWNQAMANWHHDGYVKIIKDLLDEKDLEAQNFQHERKQIEEQFNTNAKKEEKTIMHPIMLPLDLYTKDGKPADLVELVFQIDKTLKAYRTVAILSQQAARNLNHEEATLLVEAQVKALL